MNCVSRALAGGWAGVRRFYYTTTNVGGNLGKIPEQLFPLGWRQSWTDGVLGGS